MGKRVAIVIAVENYSDPRISKVSYAEADAKGFAEALEVAGPVDKVLLLSAKATKTSIKSKISQHVKSLTDEDELFLFYAGHGFSKNSHNYISCHDTDPDDLDGTCISLQSILSLCAKSKCKRIALFLDSCESGIAELPKVRGIYTEMSAGELKEFFEAAEYRVCFASCKTSESSYPSDALKHGVWTHLVIEALQGNDPLALEKGRYVTANSLQNYVAKELPRTMRKLFTKPIVQTPWFHGSNTGDFLIADLGDVLKKRNAVKPGFEQVTQVLLQVQESIDIDDLSGFSKNKRHFVPDGVSSGSQSFVEDISQKEVDDEFKAVHDRIKNAMNYKRRDLVAEHGRIITPDFEFSVTCEQDRDNPGSALMTRQLINISPAIVGNDAFNEAFEDYFDELTFGFSKPVNVKDIIDRIQDLESDTIDIDYPPDCSHCDIEIDGSAFKIRVTRRSLTMQTPRPASPKLLVETFFEAQKQLAGTPLIKAIAAKAK
jgi:Caspase domain